MLEVTCDAAIRTISTVNIMDGSRSSQPPGDMSTYQSPSVPVYMYMCRFYTFERTCVFLISNNIGFYIINAMPQLSERNLAWNLKNTGPQTC